ncbi:MAG: hypothetical protein H7A44_05705 [Opitutaceae bacterium]|jgi:Spy/CpxP family protein refolding chaperone|nr:hypothetical protein [Cephaloticoccus sp.]MCP5529919.1 hypothetical protein [Opitutaceae bacterium]
MNKPWKVILAFIGVFLAGAVVGGIVTLRFVREFARDFRPMDRFEPLLMKRYASRLDLSEEQRKRVREIVRTTENELRRLRSEGFKEAVAAGEKMNAQIEQILTPEQRVRLEELKQEMRERWKLERVNRVMHPDRPVGDGPPRMPTPPPPGDERR